MNRLASILAWLVTTLRIEAVVHTKSFRKSKNARATTSLVDTSASLTALYNAVLDSYSQELSFYNDIITTCKDQVASSNARVDGYELALAEATAESVKENAAIGGGSAQFSHQTKLLGEIQESFNSTSAQLKNEQTSFAEWSVVSTAQVQVSQDVLQKLQDQRSLISSTDNTTSSSSELDYIIGIFSNIVSTVTSSAAEQTAEHQRKDGEFVSLIDSYHKSVVDADGELNNARANVCASKRRKTTADERKAALDTFVAAEKTKGTIRQQICGTASSDSKTGLAHQLTDALTYGFNTFDREVKQALQTMSELIAVEPLATTSLLALHSFPIAASTQKRRAIPHRLDPRQPLRSFVGPLSVVSKNIVVSHNLTITTHEEKLLRAPTISAPPSTLETTARFVNATISEALTKVLQRHGAAADMVANALSVLSRTRVLGNRSHVADQPTTCYDKRTQILQESIAKRSQIRESSCGATKATIKADAAEALAAQETQRMQTLTTDHNSLSATNVDGASNTFREYMAGGATQEVDAIAANITSYINAGAPAKASGLPVLITQIRSSMQNMQVAVGADGSSKLASLRSALQKLDIAYTEDQSAGAGRVQTLNSEVTAKRTVASTQTTQEQAQAQALVDIEARRLAIEEQCRAGEMPAAAAALL